MARETPVRATERDTEKMSLPAVTIIPDTPPPEYDDVMSEVRNENGLDSGAVAECLLEKSGAGVDVSGSNLSQPDDPWAPPVIQINQEDVTRKWSELGVCSKCRVVTWRVCKPVALICLLYIFICSLGLLASAFRLLGGKAAGNVLSDNQLLQNPIAGLMIGVLATVLVQSSSTSTSIVVTMVASGLMSVPVAIPLIMGANIGTSVTNTIVSLAQSANRNEFRRAFGGATVHDMFNWLTVLVLLPLECATGYLFKLTSVIVRTYKLDTAVGTKQDLLKVLTKPLTNLIVMLDKNVIKKIAMGHSEYMNHSLLKVWCKFEDAPENVTSVVDGVENATYSTNNATSDVHKIGIEKCSSLFSLLGMNDTISGAILLVVSITILCSCLVCMVKLLHSMMRGSIAKTIHKFVNADFPGKLSFLTGYVAIFVAAGLTILVQSSSIFTSALTPLVGIGILRIERMYPLCLGSNIGTTATSILAALAAPGDRLPFALQIALCHLFFNVSGILIFYPVPFMRRIPIGIAKMLGNTTAKYRWFAIIYLLLMFLVLPAVVFSLSMAGMVPFGIIGGVIVCFIAIIVLVNVIQHKRRSILPKFLRTWDFLPNCLHSLKPIDRLFQRVIDIFPCCSRCRNPPPTNESSLDSSCAPVYMGELDVSPLSSRSTSALITVKTRL